MPLTLCSSVYSSLHFLWCHCALDNLCGFLFGVIRLLLLRILLSWLRQSFYSCFFFITGIFSQYQLISSFLFLFHVGLYYDTSSAWFPPIFVAASIILSIIHLYHFITNMLLNTRISFKIVVYTYIFILKNK